MQALRALRALRPLRTINRFDNLRAIVVAFIEAMPMLTSVVMLTLSALFMWALISMQLFAPVYFQVCTDDVTGEPEPNDTEEFSCGARECVPEIPREIPDASECELCTSSTYHHAILQ